MKRFNVTFLVVALCVAGTPALAADFDGSKPLICSAIEAHECELGMKCQQGLAADLNVPQFIRFDFAAKTLSARDRSTQMQSQARGNGMLLVQGFENGRAFSITISEESGKLVGAIAADGEGFMIFGACTAL